MIPADVFQEACKEAFLRTQKNKNIQAADIEKLRH